MTTTEIELYRPPRGAVVAAWKPHGSSTPTATTVRARAVAVAATATALLVVAAVALGLTVDGDWAGWALTAAGVSTVVALLALADRRAV